ncbi:hypothetical protein [Membranihabitans maritimus]|nr:hypothetical protein [Membranihabitans maritimus]
MVLRDFEKAGGVAMIAVPIKLTLPQNDPPGSHWDLFGQSISLL